MTDRTRAALRALAAFLALAAAVRVAVITRHALVELMHRTPADAPDQVLADRVRTQLGPVTRRLDIPHVHVMVERGLAILHGDVGDDAAARAIEAAAAATPGIKAVDSRLHVGLLAGDTRPSSGAEAPSRAHAELVDAATHAGGGDASAALAAGAVLRSFAAALPGDVRAQVQSHLPADAASMFDDAGRSWLQPDMTVADLYAAVAATGAVTPQHIPWVVASVLETLRRLIESDAGAVERSLPTEIAHLWAGRARRVTTGA